MSNKYYIACMVLAGIGDCIGFNNGIYEFNEGKEFSKKKYGDYFLDIASEYSNYIVFDFLSKGGFSTFPTENMMISDDTLFHIAISKALLEKDNNIIEKMKENMIQLINTPEKIKDMQNNRAIGITTFKNLNKLINKQDIQYNPTDGGNGGCMRSMCIGLAFNGLTNREKLLEITIDSCKLTHNNAIAYLGSFACSLFIALAIERVDPPYWITELLNILNSDIIDKYILKKYKKDFDFYNKDKQIFIKKWKDYKELRFVKHKFVIDEHLKIPAKRMLQFYKKFAYDSDVIYPGAGGDDCIIIAYDSLLECNGNWDTLVTYSMLHIGDSDTTGTVAAAFFGAYYGYDKLSSDMVKRFKETEILELIANKIFNRFNKII